MFDELTFLNTTTEGENSTEYTPVPEKEYQAVILKIGTRNGSGDKGDWAVLDVTWQIDDAIAAEITGIDSPTVRQTIFLNLSESGGLDMGRGKNIQLGRLREAVGQNSGAWTPTMLEGNVATIKVEHRIHDGRTYADVRNVSAI